MAVKDGTLENDKGTFAFGDESDVNSRIVNRRLLEDTNRAETESQPWSGRLVVWEVIGAPRMTGTIRKAFRKGVGLDPSQVMGFPIT